MGYLTQLWTDWFGRPEDAPSTAKGTADRMTHMETGIAAAADVADAAATPASVATAIAASIPASVDVTKASNTSFTTTTLTAGPELIAALGDGTWDVTAQLEYDGTNADDGVIDFTFDGTATVRGKTDPIPGTSAANASFTTTSGGTVYGGTNTVYSLRDWQRKIFLGCADDGAGTPTPVPLQVFVSLRVVVTAAGTLKIRGAKNTNTVTSIPFRLLAGSNLAAIRIGD